jgi:hypothetical protein
MHACFQSSSIALPCTHIHTYIHIYILWHKLHMTPPSTYTHTNMHTYMHIYILWHNLHGTPPPRRPRSRAKISLGMHVWCVHIHTYMHACLESSFLCTHIYIYTCMPTFIYTYFGTSCIVLRRLGGLVLAPK